MAAVLEKACPAGLEALDNKKKIPWTRHLDAVYGACGFEALGLASKEEFRKVSGPEAGGSGYS